MWGQLVGEHLWQSSGCQLPNILETLFYLLNGLVVLSWPIPPCQDHISSTQSGRSWKLFFQTWDLTFSWTVTSRVKWESQGVTVSEWEDARGVMVSVSPRAPGSWDRGKEQGAPCTRSWDVGDAPAQAAGWSVRQTAPVSLDLPAPSKALHFPCSAQKQEEILHPDSHMGWSMKTILSTSRQSCSAELYK